MAPTTTSGSVARGHMLLVALVLTTLLSVALSMTLQPIKSTNQRMKERELIYRGEHLAEGIRRFYGKNGRFPFSLEEMIEAEPRFIRELYPDPMTKDGEWNLVYLTPTDALAVRSLNRSVQRLLGQEETELNAENAQEREGTGLRPSQSSVFRTDTYQITGVRSKSDEVGFAVRDDSSIYSDWLFSALPKPDKSLRDLIKQTTGQDRGP